MGFFSKNKEELSQNEFNNYVSKTRGYVEYFADVLTLGYQAQNVSRLEFKSWYNKYYDEYEKMRDEYNSIQNSLKGSEKVISKSMEVSLAFSSYKLKCSKISSELANLMYEGTIS